MKNHLPILVFLMLVFCFTGNSQNNIPDTLFGMDSWMRIETGPNEQGGKLILQQDGKILVCGFDYSSAANDFHIDMARLDLCGSLDESFGASGVVHHKFDQRNVGYDFGLQSDGKIVVAGIQAPSNSGSQQISAVSRFNTDGTPDLTFNSTGTHALRYDNISSGTFYSVFPMDDGRILCIGTCRSNINGGTNAAGAMRFMSDGSLDETFDSDGKQRVSAQSYIRYGNTSGHLRPDGKIVLTTHAEKNTGGHFLFAAQLNEDGSVDQDFNNGVAFIDDVSVSSSEGPTSSVLLDDGKLIMAANLPGNDQVIITRLTKNGFLDVSFGDNGKVYYDIEGFILSGVHSLSDGRFLLRGRYSYGFGVGAGIMFNANGTPDNAYGDNGFQVVDMNGNTGTHSLDGFLEMPDGGWLYSGASLDFRLRRFVAESNVPHITREGDLLSTTGGPNYQWYLNDQPVDGANGRTHILEENGIYSVRVTDVNGCTHLSGPFEVGNLGVFETILAMRTFIMPNPAFESVSIESEIGTMLKITDQFGREMLKDESITKNRTLDVSSYPSGVYLVLFYNEGQGMLGSGKMVVRK